MRGPALLLALVLLALPLAGCVSGPSSSSSDQDARQVRAAAPPVAVFPGAYTFDGRASQVLAGGLYGVLPMEEVYVPSALDGVDIQMAIWRPDTPDDVRVPAIIQASPYFSDAKALETRVGQFSLDNFVPHGYAYVQLPVRSTGNSGGCDDFRGPNMVHDLSQAVDWLAAQPWSDGNATLYGISYVGTTPWYAASSGNPHIKTIIPVSGSTNAWEVYNRNGSSEGRSRTIISGYGTSAASNPQRTPEHKVENFSCTEVYEAWAAGAYAGTTGDKDPFREFWDERNVKPKVEANYRGSVFVVHGFEDWNVDPAVVFPWARELNVTYGLPVKTLIGQWVHTFPDLGSEQTRRWDYAETLLHWLDYWLKGIPTDLGPAVQVQDNQMRWRNELHYPPRDADWTRLHLAAGGELKEQPGEPGSVRLVPTTLAADQLRGGVGGLSFFQDFRWGPFDQEVLVSGLPRVHVTVTPQGPGGYLGAHLYDFDPKDNSEKRIGWTSMNLRFHDGTDRPQAVAPGEPILAKMEIQPMDAALPAGHLLVLRIWVNPHADRQPSVPPTIVDLNFGGNTPSFVELPILARDSADYFQPPMPPKAEP